MACSRYLSPRPWSTHYQHTRKPALIYPYRAKLGFRNGIINKNELQFTFCVIWISFNTLPSQTDHGSASLMCVHEHTDLRRRPAEQQNNRSQAECGMRRNKPVTQKEQTYPDAFNLIATTELQGKITAANEAFPEVSGYTARNRKISVTAWLRPNCSPATS